MKLSKIFSLLRKKCSTAIANIKQYRAAEPKYRVHSVHKNGGDDYEVIVQMVNMNCFFKIKPEEILANDNMTDSFSQRDIRALTYLGYLEINSPKFKILAKRLSEQDKKMVFAIKERGNRKPLIKTADELSSDETIIKNLTQKDAHMVGYTVGSENVLMEKRAMKRLLKEKSEEE